MMVADIDLMGDGVDAVGLRCVLGDRARCGPKVVGILQNRYGFYNCVVRRVAMM